MKIVFEYKHFRQNQTKSCSFERGLLSLCFQFISSKRTQSLNNRNCPELSWNTQHHLVSAAKFNLYFSETSEKQTKSFPPYTKIISWLLKRNLSLFIKWKFVNEALYKEYFRIQTSFLFFVFADYHFWRDLPVKYFINNWSLLPLLLYNNTTCLTPLLLWSEK